MLLLAVICGAEPISRSLAADDGATGPFVTPSVDVDVRYEMASPDGGKPVGQRMRWQVSSLRQRIDPEGSAVYMVTSWRDGTLAVVDTLHRRRSVMPAPGAALTPPGQVAPGSFQRLGSDMAAGQSCVLWRTADQDGRPVDACYTVDGILVRVSQQGQVKVNAVSVSRTAQSDDVFAVPSDFAVAAPAR
nr:hypothetical protein [Acetobacter sacchari]